MYVFFFCLTTKEEKMPGIFTFCLDTKSNKKVKRQIARRPAKFSMAKSKELAYGSDSF